MFRLRRIEDKDRQSGRFMDPVSVEDWLDIASDRKRDAEHINNADDDSIGAAYMGGFAVECTLKAALKMKGKSIPRGRYGHDLRNMVSLLNIPFQRVGGEAWFLDEWTVDWRYVKSSDLAKPISEYVLASMKIKKYLDKYVDREKRRGR